MNSMKKSKKIITLLMAFSICLSGIFYENTTVYAIDDTTVQTIVEDGVEYRITTKKFGDDVQTTIEYDDKKIETRLEDDIVTATEYECTGTTFFGNDKFEVTRSKEIDLDDANEANEDVRAQYSWNSRTYTPADWGSRYWYQYGTSSYDNAYLQIGCKASYRLKYYKLSSKKQRECKSLTNKIKKCKKNYTLGAVGLSASKLAAVVGLIIFDCATIEIPIGVVVTAIVAVVGGFAGSIKYLVTSYYDYLDVRDDYTIVRTYGNKL